MIRAWEGGASNKSDGDSTHTSYESMDFQRWFYNGAGKGMFPDSTWGDERMYAVPICNCHDSLNTKSQLKMLLHSECSSQITSMKTMLRKYGNFRHSNSPGPQMFQAIFWSLFPLHSPLQKGGHPAVWLGTLHKFTDSTASDNPELLSCFVNEKTTWYK